MGGFAPAGADEWALGRCRRGITRFKPIYGMSNDAQQDKIHAILAAFSLGEARQVIALGGTATWKCAVECARGRFVVRARPADLSEEKMARFDHEVLWRLVKAGLPVPCPQKRSDGTSWLHIGGQLVEIFSWVEGLPFAWSDLAAVEDLGRFLARFHAALAEDVPPGKEAFLREDHPDLLTKYVTEIERLCESESQARQIRQIGEQIELVRENLDCRLWPCLPQALIHGDIHPGNVRFLHSQVAAVYDFDYLSVQARMRDVVDGLMFFAGRRDSLLDPDDIYSLAQPFVLEPDRSRLLLASYRQISTLTEPEWEAMPWLIRSQWCNVRLRGSRKVPPTAKPSFAVNRFFEVIEWLDRFAPTFFRELRAAQE
jgi:Ser/Thr protein kinase RdoA (MazF antagonist)